MTNLSIADLEARILSAREAYYNSESEVSDAEYDAWLDELTKLKPESEALTMVGMPATSEWKKMTHPTPLGSLDKFNTLLEMGAWVAGKLGGSATLVSEKLDGISLGLVYADGKLVAALTRGDGLIGEDILSNAIKMHGVIKKIDGFSGTVRGEIVLTKTNHQKWFKDYANPRNAASGISRRFDNEGAEHLTVIAYDVMPTDATSFKTEQKKFEWLTTNGFLVPNYKLCRSSAEIGMLWQEYQDKTRATLDYDIDGLVIAMDNLTLPLAKESHNLRPRSKQAFKFLNQFIETTVNKVEWQIGGSGRVVPVCWFEPVSVMGAVLEKASVYNAAYIKKLGIGVGATVMVCRANEVIPRVEKVIVPSKEVVSPPSFCPSCDTKLLVQGEYLICSNREGCKPQVIGRIARWVSELNILELGDVLMEKLVARGLIKTPADLYALSIEQLAAVDRMGKKSALNVYQSIWKCNPISLDLFLGSLSVPLIGSSMIRMVMGAGYDTLEKIREIKQEEIEKIKGYGVGGAKATALFQGLRDNSELIDQLLANGVKIEKEMKMEATSDKLNGMSFCMTGKAERSRKELEGLIAENGGEVRSSVSAGLTHLIIADPDSTSSKAVKARKFGTQLISENQFLAMIGE